MIAEKITDSRADRILQVFDDLVEKASNASQKLEKVCYCLTGMPPTAIPIGKKIPRALVMTAFLAASNRLHPLSRCI